MIRELARLVELMSPTMLIAAKSRLKQSYDALSATSGRKLPRVMSTVKVFVLQADRESKKHYSVTFKLSNISTHL